MTTRFRSIARALPAVLAAVLCASPGGAQTLYGVTHAPGASALRAIQPLTGASAAVLPLGLDAIVTSAVAASIPGDRVYVAGRLAGAHTLAVVDPAAPALVTTALDRGFANFHARADGKLVGLSSNTGTWEVRSLDPSTGTSTLLAAAPSLGVLAPAASALAPGVALYQVGRSTGDPGTPRLFVFHPGTGALSGSPALAREFHSLHVRLDGTLMGLSWNGSAEELHAIDPVTGASAAYRTFPAFGVLPPAAGANDRAAGRVYQVGHAASPADPPRLYGEDAVSGGPFTSNVALGERYAALVHASGSTVAVGGGPESHPLALSVARPNPFHGATVIPFSIDRTTRVTIEILDVAGRVVRTMLDGTREAGAHAVTWRGEDDRGRPLAAGVYLVRMHAGETRMVRRIVRFE